MTEPALLPATRAGIPAAEDVVRLWPSGRRPPGERVLAFLRAVDGEAALGYTLGVRNKRLLALHDALTRPALEAHATCPACGTDNEFLLPVRAVTELADPPEQATATININGIPYAFRLPVLADLRATDGLSGLAAATCLDPPAPPVGADDLDRLAAAWEQLDPAGSLRIDLRCAECGRDIAAQADPADFVCQALDQLVDRLMRDIDVIAGRYGWSEAAILALPAGRRRRYVELIASAAGR